MGGLVARRYTVSLSRLLCLGPTRILSTRSSLKMHIKLLGILFLGALSFACGNTSRPQKTCNVPAIGGGEDDGPAILAAFKECSRDAKIVLDKYYVVDTLLLTKDLDNVQIELSGTGEHVVSFVVWPIL